MNGSQDAAYKRTLTCVIHIVSKSTEGVNLVSAPIPADVLGQWLSLRLHVTHMVHAPSSVLCVAALNLVLGYNKEHKKESSEDAQAHRMLSLLNRWTMSLTLWLVKRLVFLADQAGRRVLLERAHEAIAVELHQMELLFIRPCRSIIPMRTHNGLTALHAAVSRRYGGAGAATLSTPCRTSLPQGPVDLHMFFATAHARANATLPRDFLQITWDVINPKQLDSTVRHTLRSFPFHSGTEPSDTQPRNHGGSPSPSVSLAGDVRTAALTNATLSPLLHLTPSNAAARNDGTNPCAQLSRRERRQLYQFLEGVAYNMLVKMQVVDDDIADTNGTASSSSATRDASDSSACGSMIGQCYYALPLMVNFLELCDALQSPVGPGTESSAAADAAAWNAGLGRLCAAMQVAVRHLFVTSIKAALAGYKKLPSSKPSVSSATNSAGRDATVRVGRWENNTGRVLTPAIHVLLCSVVEPTLDVIQRYAQQQQQQLNPPAAASISTRASLSTSGSGVAWAAGAAHATTTTSSPVSSSLSLRSLYSKEVKSILKDVVTLELNHTMQRHPSLSEQIRSDHEVVMMYINRER